MTEHSNTDEKKDPTYKPNLKYEQKLSEIRNKNEIRSSDSSANSLQDHLIEKLLQKISLSENTLFNIDNSEPFEKIVTRPSFSIPLMSSNFRRFSARIGALFTLQRKIGNLLSWESPRQTLSVLAIFTLICLETYLMGVLPFAIILALFTNYYSIQYPSTFTLAHKSQNVILDEPNSSTPSIKPIKERSKKFFQNMRDIQNIMEDYSQFHDHVTRDVIPLMDFSNEEMSINLFHFFFLAFIVSFFISHLIPWRVVLLMSGWIVTFLNHPILKKEMLAMYEHHLSIKASKFKRFIDKLTLENTLLNPSQEREVEIFELQHLSSAGEWEPWLFSRTPYFLSQVACTRLERPKGARFFEDVQPPPGWQWTETKWTLDLFSREWVEERNIIGVEITTENERWVYDLCHDGNDEIMGIKNQENIYHKGEQNSILFSDDRFDLCGNEKCRGEWRRRRWVRTVRRIWSKNSL